MYQVIINHRQYSLTTEQLKKAQRNNLSVLFVL
jgi:hypothetical protein